MGRIADWFNSFYDEPYTDISRVKKDKDISDRRKKKFVKNKDKSRRNKDTSISGVTDESEEITLNSEVLKKIYECDLRFAKEEKAYCELRREVDELVDDYVLYRVKSEQNSQKLSSLRKLANEIGILFKEVRCSMIELEYKWIETEESLNLENELESRYIQLTRMLVEERKSLDAYKEMLKSSLKTDKRNEEENEEAIALPEKKYIYLYIPYSNGGFYAQNVLHGGSENVALFRLELVDEKEEMGKLIPLEESQSVLFARKDYLESVYVIKSDSGENKRIQVEEPSVYKKDGDGWKLERKGTIIL